jgi:hypothetical protein
LRWWKQFFVFHGPNHHAHDNSSTQFFGTADDAGFGSNNSIKARSSDDNIAAGPSRATDSNAGL